MELQIDAASNGQTTHAEMKDRSIRCALWLEQQGLGPDDVVSICTHSQLDAYIPVFATFFAQAVMSPWRYDLTLDQARLWLELFESKVIFARVEAVDLLEKAVARTKLSPKIVAMGQHPSRKSPKDIAAILNSSGTTGLPKGVMISSEALLRNALNCELRLTGKRVWWYEQPGGVMCNVLMLGCVLRSGTRLIGNDLRPDEVCRVIEQFQVNYAILGPAALNLLARFDGIDDYDISGLELLRNGGTRLNRATFDKLISTCLRDMFAQGYGTTEIGAMRLHPKSDQIQRSHNSIGYVTPHIQLKMIDRKSGETLGANRVGEILIKTATPMLGYYKDPVTTSRALDAKGWYHTQDLGYYDNTGEVFIMGRVTDASEYHGREIFTSDVEDVLWAHPAVTDVAVVAIPRESVGQVPVAFVVKRPGEKVAESEIIETLRAVDEFQTLPLSVQFINKIPMTPSVKVAKGDLIELALKLTSKY